MPCVRKRHSFTFPPVPRKDIHLDFPYIPSCQSIQINSAIPHEDAQRLSDLRSSSDELLPKVSIFVLFKCDSVVNTAEAKYRYLEHTIHLQTLNLVCDSEIVLKP